MGDATGKGGDIDKSVYYLQVEPDVNVLYRGFRNVWYRLTQRYSRDQAINEKSKLARRLNIRDDDVSVLMHLRCNY